MIIAPESIYCGEVVLLTKAPSQYLPDVVITPEKSDHPTSNNCNLLSAAVFQCDDDVTSDDLLTHVRVIGDC